MLKRLFETEAGWPALILRLGLGVVFLAHGSQKVLGLWGGGGLSASYHAFTAQMGIPGVLAVLAIATEFIGSLCVLAGLLTRPAALAIAVEMVVAVRMAHWQHGFFMNWFGRMPAGAEGFEYHILLITIAVALVMGGGGRLSADRAIAGMMGSRKKGG